MRKAVESLNPQHETHAGIDLVALLNPAEYFSSPSQVLEASALTEQEKRAILASWASDQYTVESVPGLRELPGSHALVRLQDILAALRQLDEPQIEVPRSWQPKGLKRRGEYATRRFSLDLQKNLEEDLELKNPRN